MNMIDVALKARDCGLSVVPILKETKTARCKWKDFQSRIMGEDEIRSTFREDDWFAVIAGEVSQNLELMDFDIPGKHHLPKGTKGEAPAYAPFVAFVKEHGYEELLSRLILMQTKSGGMGIIYRCPEGVGPNSKLAERWSTPEEIEAEPDNKKKVLIETRGNGGYFLTSPTPGYKLIQGTLTKIPNIDAEEREFLHSVARFFNECEPEVQAPERSSPGLQRPGDDFNKRVTWDEVLTGWKRGGTSGGRTYWTRPGKMAKDGISATTGNGPNDLLYIFSTSCHPFESEKSYSKFYAYALINHHGDPVFAAQELKAKGYGVSAKSPTYNPQTIVKPSPDSLYDIEGDDTFDTVSLSDAEPEKPEWTWDPYIMKRHINLLDAKGSSGKTTLIVGLALSLSIGRIPFGGECEPQTTLYFGCEDTPGEVRYLADKIGGDLTRFIHVADPSIRLDAAGLAKVYRTIKKHNASLVCFDAITYYYAGMVRDPFNGMELAPHLNKLRDLAREANVGIWNVRHFAKYSKGKDIEEMGAGAEQWRNSHRRQLVLRPNPNKALRQGIVCPARGSLNAGAGDPFAFSMENDVFGWIRNPDLSVFDQEADKQGPPPKKLDEAKAFIRTTCSGQYILSTKVWEQARALFISEPTLKRASSEMKESGELVYKRWDKEGPWSWHVPIVELNIFENP